MALPAYHSIHIMVFPSLPRLESRTKPNKNKPVSSSSRPPPERRMLPIQILHLLLRHTRELLLYAPPLTLLIIERHPQQRQRRHNQHRPRGSKVQPVTNRVIWPVPRQERPGGDESTDVAHHDVEPDGRTAGRVRHNVG